MKVAAIETILKYETVKSNAARNIAVKQKWVYCRIVNLLTINEGFNLYECGYFYLDELKEMIFKTSFIALCERC